MNRIIVNSQSTPPYKNVSGWVIVNKPLGLTSTQVVGKIRRLLNTKKVGHAGTLDPLADGVLPIALGEATKTIPYIMDATKTYRFTLKLGERTETDDMEGEIVESNSYIPTEEEIHKTIPLFTGEISQVPPIYSAIKVDGKRAYDLARRGEKPVLSSRNITIYNLTLEKYEYPYATFNTHCSKGTYIRSLGRDIAKNMGTLAHISQLTRTSVKDFSLESAFLLEKIEKIVHCAPSHCQNENILLPLEAALDDIPVLLLKDNDMLLIRNGNQVLASNSSDISLIRGEYEGRTVALGKVSDGFFKPKRVFNY